MNPYQISSLIFFFTLDAAAKKLGVAMSEVGFMYLINIPGFRPDELYQGNDYKFIFYCSNYA